MRQKVNDNFAFVYVGRPESYNADNKKKEIYKKHIASTYERKWDGMISDGELYACVYYFYRDDVGLDTDNISKPIWDALNLHGYTDDKQIKIRCAASYNLLEHGTLNFDQTSFPNDLWYDLLYSITENNHTLLIQVGKIDNYDNFFNIKCLWD
ncbi:MAG: RusA family crossover junction endodeoxyribonuclease [Bacteroidaceae bacterium]|nr:RusA family crossover junction endodeoxyribonuclease [Bacteroidaceae bacterium]